MLVRRLRVVHEGFVMRDVIAGVHDRIIPRQARMMLATYGAALRVHSGWRKASLKPSPGDALGIQQIAHVLARHGDLVHLLELWIGGHAIVQERPRIAD